MKRTISVILTVLLLSLTAFALVACDGGVKTEDDWNKALNYLETCDSITLKMNEKSVQGTGLDKSKHKIKVTIAYDAKNGVLNYYKETSPYSAFGFRRYTSHEDYYFIVEGMDVKTYTLSWMDNGEAEKQTDLEHYDSAEAANLALREKYLEYLHDTQITDLVFDVFSPRLLGGYKAISLGAIVKVSFSGGKVTKYHYNNMAIGSPNSMKRSVSIKYKAKITLPD